MIDRDCRRVARFAVCYQTSSVQWNRWVLSRWSESYDPHPYRDVIHRTRHRGKPSTATRNVFATEPTVHPHESTDPTGTAERCSPARGRLLIRYLPQSDDALPLPVCGWTRVRHSSAGGRARRYLVPDLFRQDAQITAGFKGRCCSAGRTVCFQKVHPSSQSPQVPVCRWTSIRNRCVQCALWH